MTPKQRIIKFIYPLLRSYSASTLVSNGIRANVNEAVPDQVFYSLQGVLSNGTQFDFSALIKKKVILVNVASDCGYTPQYTELQQLQELYEDRLVVLGFPANDFKGQEPGTDKEIEAFCQKNYAITFPMFQKHSVLKPGQNSIFKWLSSKELNGWNDQQPVWNFCKYLVGDDGKLQYYFPPSVSPLSKGMLSAIDIPLR
ncbi:MAG: glutathione peroxidase [Chitinophagaceae bacterium]